MPSLVPVSREFNLETPPGTMPIRLNLMASLGAAFCAAQLPIRHNCYTSLVALAFLPDIPAFH